MKQPNRLRPAGHTEQTAQSQRMVPKVKIELTEADDATREAIERAIGCALRNVASGSVTVKRVLA
jgi:hypothetical protein